MNQLTISASSLGKLFIVLLFLSDAFFLQYFDAAFPDLDFSEL